MRRKLQQFLISQGDAHKGNGNHFQDCCLVDALRALGHKVSYTRDGPFKIRDGNAWLEPSGQLGNCEKRRKRIKKCAVCALKHACFLGFYFVV